MKRTDERWQTSSGRRRQRITTSQSHVVEDLAEVNHANYERLEIDFLGTWKLGANLAALAGIVVLTLAILQLVQGAAIVALAWVPGALVLSMLGAFTMPSLIAVTFGLLTQVNLHRRQHIDSLAAYNSSKRTYVQANHQLVTTQIETQYKVEDLQQHQQSRQLAALVSQQNDLRQFAAAIFARDESPSFRNWKGRQLPSGHAVTHERWQQDLIEPLLTVGALQRPATKGQPYQVIDGDYAVVERRLVAAGFLES